MQPKHGKETTKKQKILLIILGIIILIVLVSIIFFTLPNYYQIQDMNNNDIPENIQTEEPVEEPKEEQKQEFEIVDTSDIPDTYQGYEVLGKIVIDKIGVKQIILSETTTKSLKLGVTKFWGSDINEPRKFLYNGT